MSRVDIDVKVAEEFLNELRSYKVKSAEQIKDIESSIIGMNSVWDDDQSKEFSDKLLSKLRVLDEFNKGLDRIEKFVGNKVKVAGKRIV